MKFSIAIVLFGLTALAINQQCSATEQPTHEEVAQAMYAYALMSVRLTDFVDGKVNKDVLRERLAAVDMEKYLRSYRSDPHHRHLVNVLLGEASRFAPEVKPAVISKIMNYALTMPEQDFLDMLKKSHDSVQALLK